MKYCIFTVILLTCCNIAFSQTNIDSTHWLTEVNKAHVISKSTGKPIFAFFTGSDWCVWCHKLQADVFAKPAFKEWARSEVVLLELDFPSRKVLPIHIAQQNQTLKTFFKISGFPTVWLFCISEDKEKEKQFLISPYGSLGYPKNPAQGKEEIKFLENAKSILASRTCQ
jgi:thioredoxin-related protein